MHHRMGDPYLNMDDYTYIFGNNLDIPPSSGVSERIRVQFPDEGEVSAMLPLI